MKFGNILKELRIQAGLTQVQLAQKAGLSKSVISYYELQERAPSPEILLSFADIFGTSTDYLLGREPVRSINISGLNSEDIEQLNSLAEYLRKKNKNE